MSVTPYEEFRSVRHFASLDALRCFGIIGVIWQHNPGFPLEVMPFTDAGISGVALFFVVSGFLITTLLLREESETGNINLRNFYIRRSLRIFPLYYAVLALYAILVFYLEKNAAGKLFFENLPYYLTYTNNWFVDLKLNEDGQRRVIFIFAWTLATEEQFYLLWPSIMKFFRRHVAIIILLSIMAADVVLEFIFGRNDLPQNTTERLLRIATSPSTEICAGVLLAISLHTKKGFEFIWKVLGHPRSAWIAGIMAFTIINWPGPANSGWRLCQAIIFTIFVAACVVREDHGLSNVLNRKILIRIGVVSYGMYLLHMLAVNTVKQILPSIGIDSSLFSFLLAVAFAYIAAEISFRFYETPMLNLKKRFNAMRPEYTRASSISPGKLK